MKSLKDKTKMNLTKIKNLRENKNMTQEKLANYLGTRANYVSQMENGKVDTIGITALLRLSEIFGIDIHKLLEILETEKE